MYSLYIDTHFKDVDLILIDDGEIKDRIFIESIFRHSVVTMPSIRELLGRNNIALNDLKEIVVVNGPGSFTGIRIGVTIAKTMAYCLNIPIKVVDYLTLSAISLDSKKDIYVALEDKNGAFVGKYILSAKKVMDYQYISKNDFSEFKLNNDVKIVKKLNFRLIFDYLNKIKGINPHEVKPLYIKNIEALK